MSRENMVMVFGLVCISFFVGLTNQRTAANPSIRNAVVGSELSRIALVDMAKVFKTSTFFERRRDQLKEKIAGSETEAKKMAADIKALQNKLTKFEKGSDDAKELEGEIKRKTEEFEGFRKKTQEDIVKAESAIYHKTYQLVETEVADYAKQHGFDLVLRFNSEPLNDQDPQKLIQGMNRQVVFHRELDITDQIIEMVNARN